MEDIEFLKQRLIENQDIIFYFAYNSYDEQLFYGEVDNKFKIKPLELTEFIANNPDVIDGLSMKNLVNLLALKFSDTSRIQQAIIKKMELGEPIFGGEKIESRAFGIRASNFDNAFTSKNFSDDLIKKIRDNIFSRLDELYETNPEVVRLISKAGKIYSIDNFLSTYQKGWSAEKQETLQELYEENPNILDSINYGIFDDEIFSIGQDFVKHIARYPSLSTKLLIIKQNYPELFEAEKRRIIELEKEPNPEAYCIEQVLIGACAEEASKIEKTEFSDNDITDLINFYLRKRVFEFNAVNADYKEGYEEKFEDKCDKSFYETMQYIHLGYKDINDLRQIYVTKYFGMGIKEAEKFNKAYIENSSTLEFSEEMRTFINEVDEIFKVDDIDALEKKYESEEIKITPIEKIKMEMNLRRAYSKTFNDKFSETSKKLQEKPQEYIEFEGKKIPKVRLNGDFEILLSSTDTGFTEEKKLIDGSFLKSFKNINDASNHLIATCSVNQDFLGHAPVNNNGVLLCFVSDMEDKLSLFGPTDINSNICSFDYSAGRSYYMPAEELHQSSRKVYAEAAIERKGTMPDYIALWTDASEEVKSNSYKAAIEFGIPILEMDKRELALAQIGRLDEMIKTWQETKEINVLQKIISMYETNCAGWLLNRDNTKNDDSLTASINNDDLKPIFDEREQEIYVIIKSYLDEIKKEPDFDKKSRRNYIYFKI